LIARWIAQAMLSGRLAYLAMSAWWKLHKWLDKIPTREEVKKLVTTESGIKFTERHWSRVFRNIAALFETEQ
jgi:hypothetical protein